MYPFSGTMIVEILESSLAFLRADIPRTAIARKLKLRPLIVTSVLPFNLDINLGEILKDSSPNLDVSSVFILF